MIVSVCELIYVDGPHFNTVLRPLFYMMTKQEYCFPVEYLWESDSKYLEPTPVHKIIDFKDGYEETVCNNLTYLQTCENSKDESFESVDKLSNSFPECISDWNSDHIMKWILELYEKANYRFEDLHLYHFKKRNGTYLMNLTETDWEQIDKKRSKWLYRNAQNLISQHSNKNSTCNDAILPHIEPVTSDDEAVRTPPRRKRGRPRSLHAKRRPLQKIGRVWEFLRNMLLDPQYCPSLIYWEDYSTKKFRLVDGSKVANLWGLKKNNPNMTYEKFSRTIRHYYKDKVIISVPKEKLVYRFGVNAKGIETDNPNFENTNATNKR